MTGAPVGSDYDGAAISGQAPDDGSEPDAPNGMSLPGSSDAAAVTSPEASAPEEGATPPAAGDASATCMSLGGAGTLGGACEQSWGETCGGVNYQVDCSCAQGSCVCFGPTTHVVAYSGCPVCPDSDNGSVFALCGFPWGGP